MGAKLMKIEPDDHDMAELNKTRKLEGFGFFVSTVQTPDGDMAAAITPVTPDGEIAYTFILCKELTEQMIEAMQLTIPDLTFTAEMQAKRVAESMNTDLSGESIH